MKGAVATAKLTATNPPAKAELCLTSDTGPWQRRKWQSIPAEIKDGAITAALPDKTPLTFYLSVTDSNGARTTTAHAGRGGE
ncbi:MAG: hypothetical protein WCG52_09825 [bacterium]